MTNADVYYKAMLARDHRFDGKFFVGVKTTGIYCRPICPAKPKRENVEFFTSALAAEREGYRPCLRCRPEAAPLSPAWLGTSAIVQRALKVIANEGFADLNEDSFAEQFGVSARHLRRLFESEIGKTPKQIFDSNRLNFARKLVVETDLPITTIALSSGFGSLRRFNDSFKERFKKAPSDMRKRKAVADERTGVTLTLPYRPPYDWDTILAYYRRHLIPGLETVTEDSYARIFRHEGVTGFVQVRHAKERNALTVSIDVPDMKALFPVAQRIRQMFDLDSDPLLIANALALNPDLNRLWKKYPGLRIPRAWDPFEAMVCTVLGQLVSVEQASRLVGQLVRGYGEVIKQSGSTHEHHLFPTAEALAKANLREVGTTAARKNSIRALSLAVSEQKILISATQDILNFKTRLLETRGIGPWSVEYITLRALGDTDAFPDTDLIIKRALEKFPKLDMDQLRPWRAYVALYLWKEFATTRKTPQRSRK